MKPCKASAPAWTCGPLVLGSLKGRAKFFAVVVTVSALGLWGYVPPYGRPPSHLRSLKQ